MSAIAGFLRSEGPFDAGLACATMLAAQSIYGPHDLAQWDGGDIAFGRRLFRLLPEDSFARQPLQSDSGQVQVGDLSLENGRELLGQLGIPLGLGAKLADSAILLAAWEK